MKKIVILGSNGQVGMSLRAISLEYDAYQFLFWGRTDVDLCDSKLLKEKLISEKPHFIINCAAYTAVDQAEEERDICHSVNSFAVGHISEAAGEIGALVIHYSSDYVYHNQESVLLQENMETLPQGVYAQSKLDGERALVDSKAKGIIIRTSWVYSPFGHNFLKTMLRLGERKSELTIVSDQIGAPTYAPYLAQSTMKVISSIVDGKVKIEDHETITLNYSAEGLLSWYDFAKYIFDYSGIDMVLHKSTTEAYGARAPRPLWSGLDMTRIKSIFGIAPRYWKDGVKDCIEKLKNIS